VTEGSVVPSIFRHEYNFERVFVFEVFLFQGSSFSRWSLFSRGSSFWKGLSPSVFVFWAPDAPNNDAICCIEMLRSFGRGYKLLTRHSLGVLSIAFVVVVVSVPVHGIFPVLFMKKHLS